MSDGVVVDGHPQARLLRPLARLRGDRWGTVGEAREIARIPCTGTSSGAA